MTLSMRQLCLGLFLFLWTTTAFSTEQEKEEDLLSPSSIREDTHVQPNFSTSKGGKVPCGLWLAPSTLGDGLLNLFSGVSLSSGGIVGKPDVLIHLYDGNWNEHSQLRDFAWYADTRNDESLQNWFHSRAFLPGVDNHILCSKQLQNVETSEEYMQSTDVHRSQHASAGSFSYRRGSHFHSTQTIAAGQELFTSCSDNNDNDTTKQQQQQQQRPLIRPLSWLQTNGVCIEHLEIRQSIIPNIGRGAFSKTNIKRGETIVSSPIIQFHRSQMEIVKQFLDVTTGRVKYTDHVQSQQLLLNYCFGTKNSNLLSLPSGPGVNFINHAPTATATATATTLVQTQDGWNTATTSKRVPPTANAAIVWSESELNKNYSFAASAGAVMEFGRGQILDYVATRDIAIGEEIFLDYGHDWQEEWTRHVQEWQPTNGSETYLSAAQYKQIHSDERVFRTEEEQQTQPYPESIRTACQFQEIPTVGGTSRVDGTAADTAVFWSDHNGDCMRPCKILDRDLIAGHYYYTVQVEEMKNHFTPDYCKLSNATRTVLRTPEAAIHLIDKEYTSDQFLPNAFRHEIGIPSNLYPQSWMLEDYHSTGEFVTDGLVLNQLEQIKWKSTGEVITPHAYLMRQNPKIRESLLEYCNRMGITERFRDLTYRGNALAAGDEMNVVMQDLNWYVQRPPKDWMSNMHWISPLDESSQENYLQALSAAGFDEVLQAIGEQLGLDSLACYHLSFIGVSRSVRGYIHYDIIGSGAKVYNVIIPLILANHTAPELLLDRNGKGADLDIGRLRYQYDVACLVGDNAHHGTAAVDYWRNKEMRMAATVYIADIREDNIEAIMNDYTQHYPPKDRPDVLMGMAGSHWKRDDPSVKLPSPVVLNDIETQSHAR